MAINWNTTENSNFYTVIPSYSTVTVWWDSTSSSIIRKENKKDFYKSEDFYGPAQAAGVPLVWHKISSYFWIETEYKFPNQDSVSIDEWKMFLTSSRPNEKFTSMNKSHGRTLSNVSWIRQNLMYLRTFSCVLWKK